MGVLHFDIHVYICSYVAMYELGSAYMYHEHSFHAGFESNPGCEVHTCTMNAHFMLGLNPIQGVRCIHVV